ncbi:MAG: hypothetical protein EOP35_00345 [Rubrivivax sp.]|nr:MAG: hypothetical protein EOP35_00345 [Rubrivivax sp.]
MIHWRLGGLTSLHWQHFDGDWVIYDDGSGQTLAADPVIAGALMALESGCSTLADIEAQVRRDLQIDADGDLNERLADGLAFLSQIGLIEAGAE